jgi:hypothetical protein
MQPALENNDCAIGSFLIHPADCVPGKRLSDLGRKYTSPQLQRAASNQPAWKAMFSTKKNPAERPRNSALRIRLRNCRPLRTSNCEPLTDH